MNTLEIVGILLLATVLLGGTALVVFSIRGARTREAGALDSRESASAPGRRPAVARAELKRLVPESKFAEVGGARLHYVQAGSGPDVVLLHGIGASVFIWRFLFPLLEMNHRVTAVDLAGFGKSAKEASRDYGLDAQTKLTSELLRAIGIERASLVGSSMGGTIALWMARAEPERFAKVAALAPASERELVPATAQHLAAATPVLRMALNRRTMRGILKRVLARQEIVTDEVVAAYLEPFLGRGESVRAFWSSLSLIRDARLPSGFKDVRSRVLVVYGARDMMVPRGAMDRLLRILPSAELITHDEGGHHIMEDEPEWLASVLERFFANN